MDVFKPVSNFEESLRLDSVSVLAGVTWILAGANSISTTTMGLAKLNRLRGGVMIITSELNTSVNNRGAIYPD